MAAIPPGSKRPHDPQEDHIVTLETCAARLTVTAACSHALPGYSDDRNSGHNGWRTYLPGKKRNRPPKGLSPLP